MIPAEEGPRLDKYEVLEEIGHGGMATVYRARDRRLGRDVAVKVIHKHLRENKEVAARFVSEARAVAKLKHPNIVEVYDVSDEADPERYLVVELVPGTTLRKLLSERGHFPAEIAAAIGLEIGGALEHAHQQGVIHRDVKPENVLVDLSERTPSGKGLRSSQERPSDIEAGRVKITDFGIAKLLDAQGVTSTGQVLGSPAHMAPEQIEGGDVTARADVFGLGVLLYECMVGRLPFDGKNPAQVLRKVLDGTFTPPERARPSVGIAFSRIVERALAREPENRYASAAELGEALRAELDALGFENPRRELAEFLVAPDKYNEDYERRVVTRLVELGKQARSARQPPAAAALFNRALAFRPDDADLLKQVAGLAESERRKRLGVRAAAVLGIAAVFGLATFGVSRATRPKLHLQPDVPFDPTTKVERVTPPDKSVAPPPSASAPELPEHVKPNVLKAVLAVIDAGLAADGKTRKVRVVVQGAKGIVRVDGTAQDWFGKELELEVGPHRFEFVPPDPDCCITPPAQVIKIEAGEGTQVVYGKVSFKDAMVSLSGPDGAQATCPTLFAGTLAAGSSRRIPIPGPDPTVAGLCTITGPPADSEPKSVRVELRPGQSRPLGWP